MVWEVDLTIMCMEVKILITIGISQRGGTKRKEVGLT